MIRMRRDFDRLWCHKNLESPRLRASRGRKTRLYRTVLKGRLRGPSEINADSESELKSAGEERDAVGSRPGIKTFILRDARQCSDQLS